MNRPHTRLFIVILKNSGLRCWRSNTEIFLYRMRRIYWPHILNSNRNNIFNFWKNKVETFYHIVQPSEEILLSFIQPINIFLFAYIFNQRGICLNFWSFLQVIDIFVWRKNNLNCIYLDIVTKKTYKSLSYEN